MGTLYGGGGGGGGGGGSVNRSSAIGGYTLRDRFLGGIAKTEVVP